MSVVERTLREDPAGIHGRQDFSTRDRYRHAIEALARRTTASEQEIARKAARPGKLEASGAPRLRLRRFGGQRPPRLRRSS